MDGEQLIGYRETCRLPRSLDDGHVFLELFRARPKKNVELRGGHEEKVDLLVARRHEVRRDVEMPRGDFDWGLLPLGILGILITITGHFYCVVTDRLRQGGTRDRFGNERVCADQYGLWKEE